MYVEFLIDAIPVGDIAIDEMVYGDTERISREAPVLILQHTHTNIILGAASNAAHNASMINNDSSVCKECINSLNAKYPTASEIAP